MSSEKWQYGRPSNAGAYWWQRSPDHEPRLTWLKYGIPPTDEVKFEQWYWITEGNRLFRGSDQGRWLHIPLPSAFAPWERALDLNRKEE